MAEFLPLSNKKKRHRQRVNLTHLSSKKTNKSIKKDLDKLSIFVDCFSEGWNATILVSSHSTTRRPHVVGIVAVNFK